MFTIHVHVIVDKIENKPTYFINFVQFSLKPIRSDNSFSLGRSQHNLTRIQQKLSISSIRSLYRFLVLQVTDILLDITGTHLP